MKKQLLFLSLAALILLGSCSKNEVDTLDTGAPATHISAKAQGKGDISVDTKAPQTGTSLDGQTADVYASTYDISSYTGSLLTTFSNVYARGTMTFDDANYVGFDTADFGGLDGGKKVLPQDGSLVYLYGFYPKGWARTAGTTFESLTYAFDGKTDVMSTWLTPADNLTIKYNDVANVPDKADLSFKHLLTRYSIQIKASDAEAITAWGRVQSVAIKETTVTNRVTFDKKSGAPLGINYDNDGTTLTPTSFFKLTGTSAAPTYSDTKFEAADYTASQPLTTTAANACYTMVAPVDVADADPLTPELTLEVVTIDAAGKEKTVEIPVSLLQSKFPEVAGVYSTRGYSITLTLNFRVGVIQAIATVEEWKEYGNQNIDVDMPTPAPKIGDMKDGGIIYWIDAIDATKYKVFSLTEGSNLAWSAKRTYVLGTAGQSDADGKGNVAAMKAYSTDNTNNSDDTKKTTGVFATDFPSAGFCDALNTGGVTGWYLPAKDELSALSAVYSANKTVLDAALSSNSGTAMTHYNFWSSTEFSGFTDHAWCVSVLGGGTYDGRKSEAYVLRCVKSTIPAPAPAPAIGTLKDGGIVYEAVDATKYKVFSLTEGSSLAWAAKYSYMVGAGAQSDADGKGNVAAMKAYSTDNTNNSDDTKKTTGVFATDFPSAGFCDALNTGGVTGWYLPAMDELSALYTVYNANQTVLDAALTANSGTAIPAIGYFWSSTEDGNSDYASYVNFSNGSFSSDMKHYPLGYVRCVKSTVPPPASAIGALKDGGIVYEVNGADYKVFSLTEGSYLPWSAQYDYVLGTAGQSMTDGKGNVAAMKAYSTDNTNNSDDTKKTTGVFATDFPSAGFCDALNTGGVTGWYLPARDELSALRTAYTANQTVLDAALTANSGTAISASGTFWSSTENCIDTTHAFIVGFPHGTSYYPCKQGDANSPNSVRCIKRNN